MTVNTAAPRATTPPDPNAAATVFFDGGCPLCRREIAVYRESRGAEAIDWVDLSAADDAALPEGRCRSALLARFTVRRHDGTLADGAAGFVAMWRALPRFARLGRLLDRSWILWPLERAYRGFLKIRPLWRPRAA